MGLSLAGPSSVGLGLRALRSLGCADPVSVASRFPYRPSFDGGLGRCTAAFYCGRRHLFLAGRRTPRPGPVRVCVCSPVLAGSGRAASRACSGAPHLFLWPLCLSAILGPLQAGVAPFLVLPLPPPFFSSFSFFLLFSGRPPCLLFSLVAGFGCLGPLSFSIPPPGLCVLSFPSFCALVVSALLWFPAALGLGALCVSFFFGLPPLGSPCALASFVSLAWPLAALWWLLPLPPLPFVSCGFRRCRSVLSFFLLLLSASPLSPAFSWFRPRVLWALALCVVCLVGLPLFGLPCALRPVGVSRLAVRCSLVVAAPPPPLCLAVFVAAPWDSVFFSSFFFPSLCAPVVSGFLWFSGPAALGLGTVCCLLCGPPASRLSVRSCPFCVPCLAVGCSLVAAARPPPLRVPRSSSRPLGAVCGVLCCAVCPWARCCAALLRGVPSGVVLLCAVLLCCAGSMPLLVVPCPLVLPVALGPCPVRHFALRCSPALCALCCVCFVVACRCALLFAAVRRAVFVLGCCAVRSLSSPLCAVLCLAVLVHLRCAVRVLRAVAGAWCCGALLCVVLFPLVFCVAVPGLVAPSCLLVVCYGVRLPVWLHGLLSCGWCGLLWCPASLCRVLWCCAVVLCCRFAVLLVFALPSCGLPGCAVLCCWLSVLFLARWWCLRAVVPFPSFPARTKTLIITLFYPPHVFVWVAHV